MKKLYFLIALIFVFVLTLPTLCTAESKPTETSSDLISDAQKNDMFELMLQERMTEFEKIVEILNSTRVNLKNSKVALHKSWVKARRDFIQVQKMLQINQNRPMELSSGENILSLLSQEISTTISAFKSDIEYIDRQIKILDKISLADVDLAEDNSKIFAQKLNSVLSDLKKTKKMLTDAISPHITLLSQIEKTVAELNAKLPSAWKSFYISSSNSMFSPSAWIKSIDSISSGHMLYLINTTSMIFSNPKAVQFILVKAMLVLLFSFGILYFLKRMVTHLPPMFAYGTERLISKIFWWMPIGIAFHACAWTGGMHYRLMSMTGTILLCIGQLYLSCTLYEFGAKEPSRAFASLKDMLIPQICGILLFAFDIPSQIFGLLWICVLIWCTFFIGNTKRQDSPILNFLKMAHKFVMLSSIAITLAGFGRISVLLCMVYAIIAVTIIQSIGVLKISSLISDYLEQRKTLIADFILALIVPIILLLLFVLGLFWGMAYPGFKTLVTDISTADIQLGETSFNFVEIALIISFFYLSRAMIKTGRQFIAQYVLRIKKIDPSLISPIQAGYTYTIWLIFILYVIYALGVKLSNISMIAGGLSVGVGLGMQNITNNFVSGLQLIFGKTLREGDVIEIEGKLVTVRQISIRYTLVKTFDNAVIFVPNGELLSGKLINWTRNGAMVRKEIKLGVAYGSDVTKVISILKSIAESTPHVIQTPAPSVAFSKFGDSTLDFTLYVWIDNITNGTKVISDLHIEIDKQFREENIEIAFPQMDVHVKS